MIQLTHVRVSVPVGGTFKMLRGALLRERYARERIPVLHDFTLWLGRGESWAVIGEDGAGKTTFLRLIAGKIAPDSGTCTVHGRTGAAIDTDALVPSESGAQNIRLLCRQQGMGNPETGGIVAAVHEKSGLMEKFFAPVSGYSDEQRARLLIALALAQRPDTLVIANLLDRCDEPFQNQYESEIRRMIRQGMTLLIESTDAALLRRICESALWLHAGRLKRLGPFETVYEAYAVPRAIKAYTDVKQLVSRENAAFSAPLVPETASARSSRPADWPEDARRAIIELQTLNDRLNAQLTAYAEANLAFERENERLTATADLHEIRAKDAERMLSRLFAVFTDMLQIMHAQFLHLRQLGAVSSKVKRK